MKFARAVGAVDRGGYRRIRNACTPLLGGLAIVMPFVSLCLFMALGPTGMTRAIEANAADLIVLALGGLALLAVGFVNDTRGMRARTKLSFQALIAAGVALSGHAVNSIDLPLLGTVQRRERLPNSGDAPYPPRPDFFSLDHSALFRNNSLSFLHEVLEPCRKAVGIRCRPGRTPTLVSRRMTDVCRPRQLSFFRVSIARVG